MNVVSLPKKSEAVPAYKYWSGQIMDAGRLIVTIKYPEIKSVHTCVDEKSDNNSINFV